MWIIIVGAVVAVLAVLLFCPIRFIVISDGDDVNAYVKYLFLKKRIADENGIISKPKQKPKKQKKAKKTDKSGQSGEKKKKKKVDIPATVSLITSLVGDLLKRLGKHARVTLYSYDICIASDDAAKTAIMYGAVSAATEIFMDLLSECGFFKTKCVGNSGVRVDFLAEQTTCDISVGVGITPAGAIAIAVSLGVSYIKNKINNI